MAIAVYMRMYGDLITNKRYLKEEEREGREGGFYIVIGNCEFSISLQKLEKQ